VHGRGIECRRGDIFHTRPDLSLRPHSHLHNGYWGIAGGKTAGARSKPDTFI
jgi:hypothetical protein